MLAQLRGDLDRRGVRLLVARDIGQVRDVLRRTGAEDAAAVFPSVEAAVETPPADQSRAIAAARWRSTSM